MDLTVDLDHFEELLIRYSFGERPEPRNLLTFPE